MLSEPMEPEPPYYDDLAATLDYAWHLLGEGASVSASPLHVFQFANLDPDGAPNVRSVVLRGFDSQNRRLRFHTDRHALKLQSLDNDGRVAAHFYDRERKIQLRLQGRANALADGPIVEAAWAHTQPMSKACYASAPPPGTEIAAGGHYLAVADLDNPDHGREAFRAIVMTIDRLEWLYLHSGGHRRAAFIWSDRSDGPEARWLVP